MKFACENLYKLSFIIEGLLNLVIHPLQKKCCWRESDGGE